MTRQEHAKFPISQRIREANNADNGDEIRRICDELRAGKMRFQGQRLYMDYYDQRMFFHDADASIDALRFEELMQLADVSLAR